MMFLSFQLTKSPCSSPDNEPVRQVCCSAVSDKVNNKHGVVGARHCAGSAATRSLRQAGGAWCLEAISPRDEVRSGELGCSTPAGQALGPASRPAAWTDVRKDRRHAMQEPWSPMSRYEQSIVAVVMV